MLDHRQWILNHLRRTHSVRKNIKINWWWCIIPAYCAFGRTFWTRLCFIKRLSINTNWDPFSRFQSRVYFANVKQPRKQTIITKNVECLDVRIFEKRSTLYKKISFFGLQIRGTTTSLWKLMRKIVKFTNGNLSLFDFQILSLSSESIFTCKLELWKA